MHFAHISQSFTHTNRNFNIKLFKVSHTSEQGSLLISKLEFFIKADFRGLGFFISRPSAVFYIMKVVLYKKKCTFYSFQLFLKPKQWFCQMRYCINQNTGIFWNKYLKCRPALKVFISKYSSILGDTISHLAKSVFWL